MCWRIFAERNDTLNWRMEKGTNFKKLTICLIRCLDAEIVTERIQLDVEGCN